MIINDTLVAIATFSRNDLLSGCISSIVALNDDVEVLVVDNNVEDAARSLVDGFGDKVLYLHQPLPGIAAARNSALDFASSRNYEWIAFIDDDEVARPGWLESLRRLAAETDADVVTGPAHPVLELPNHWTARRGFFQTPSHATGSEVGLASTNNVLIKRKWWGDHGLRFNSAFSASGGEDTDFFSRLGSQGGRIVWCEEAAVDDLIPAARMNWHWVRDRAIRNGQISARISSVENGYGRAGIFLRGLSRILLGLAKVAGGLFAGSPRSASNLWPLLRGLGWIRVAVGRTIVGYQSPEVEGSAAR